jgi:hypothetical protein
MVANAFAITSARRRRYNAIFPPDQDLPPADPTKITIKGSTFSLTKTWRVVESYIGKDAYLELQCYDSTNKTWVSVQYFNTTTS